MPRGSLRGYRIVVRLRQIEVLMGQGMPRIKALPMIGVTLKVLFGLPLCETVGLVESLIRMAGLQWPVLDFSTLCCRQSRITVQIGIVARLTPEA